MSKFCGGTYEKRYGSYSNALRKFREYKDENVDSKDSIASVVDVKSEAVVVENGHGDGRVRSYTYGDLVNFRGLLHAPTNENGVIYLFGMISKELGFLIESIRSSFPDCEGKYMVGENAWQKVSIEFEYKASNFKAHRHNENSVDFIICWINDWDDCPVRVIELRKEITRLPR